MPKLTEFAPPGTEPTRTLTLSYQSRTKSRLLAKLDNGEDVGLFLERGRVLRGGDVLTGQEGLGVLIIAAEEMVSVARTDDRLLLARACYHLGNRHVALQIEPGELRYLTSSTHGSARTCQKVNRWSAERINDSSNGITGC